MLGTIEAECLVGLDEATERLNAGSAVRYGPTMSQRREDVLIKIVALLVCTDQTCLTFASRSQNRS